MISFIKSPMGYYYKIDEQAPAGQRITRRSGESGKFGVGQPDFSIQMMTAAELEHIARLLRVSEGSE